VVEWEFVACERLLDAARKVEKVEKVEGKELKPPPVKLVTKSTGQPGSRCVLC
jgi:hypothetical protein